MPAALIFDMDGTIWDSRTELVTAWNQVLAQTPGLRAPFTVEEITPTLGTPFEQISDKLLPGLPRSEHKKFIERSCVYENAYIREHGATLYPQVPETLKQLKELCPLFIVSNCTPGYIEAFLGHFNAWELFSDWECHGNTGRPRGENIRLVLERNGLAERAAECAYVGDTQGDYDAAAWAGVRFIHASYGFGTVKEPVQKLERFADLPLLL